MWSVDQKSIVRTGVLLLISSQLIACTPRPTRGYAGGGTPAVRTPTPPAPAAGYNNSGTLYNDNNSLPIQNTDDGIIPPPPVGATTGADAWQSTTGDSISNHSSSAVVPPPVSSVPLDPPALPVRSKGAAFVDPVATKDGTYYRMARNSTAPAPVVEDEQETVDGGVHIVKQGETLYSIARQYRTTPTALAKRNNLPAPYAISLGQKLRVTGLPEVISATDTPEDDTHENDTLPDNSVANRLKFPATPAARGNDAPTNDNTEDGDEPPTPTHQKPTTKAAARFTPPVQGGTVKVGYGKPYKGKVSNGIVYGTYEDAPVRAAAAGQVVYVGDAAGYGKVVLIRHENGLLTNYGYLKKTLTTQGKTVAAGEVIARAGKADNASPMVVFEVRNGTTAKNPAPYLP